MNILQFIAAMTGSLAWPLAVVLCVVILRLPIIDILQRLRSLKGPAGVELTIGERADQIVAAVSGDSLLATTPTSSRERAEQSPDLRPREYDALFEQLVDKSPQAAILAAWTPVRDAIERIADANAIKTTDVGTNQIASRLAAAGLIDTQLAGSIVDLRALRIEANRGGTNATTADAFQFRTAATKIAAALYQRIAELRP